MLNQYNYTDKIIDSKQFKKNCIYKKNLFSVMGKSFVNIDLLKADKMLNVCQ